MNSTNKKSPGARGTPQPFNRQAGHIPRYKPVIAQLKTALSAQSVKQPVAPPVYRPQATPKAAQPKMASGAVNYKPPVAPPVYRPKAKKIVQPKVITQQRKSPTAPPVYRPEQTRIAQPKMASAALARKPPKSPTVYRAPPQQVSAKPHQLTQMKSKGIPSPPLHAQPVMQKMESSFTVSQLAGRMRKQFGSGIAMMQDHGLKAEAKRRGQPVGSHHFPVQPKLSSRGVIQRDVKPMDDETIKALSNLHVLGYEKERDELTNDEIERMKNGTYLLTGYYNAVNCNCFGWALGVDYDTKDKGDITRWKWEHGGEQNFTDPDSESAKIILWGDKDGQDENKWDVTHASVKLTHAELLSRSGNFTGLNISRKALKKSGIPDPFWSSAGGMNLGIFVHPRNWFEGGEYGVKLKGMKAAIGHL